MGGWLAGTCYGACDDVIVAVATVAAHRVDPRVSDASVACSNLPSYVLRFALWLEVTFTWTGGRRVLVIETEPQPTVRWVAFDQCGPVCLELGSPVMLGISG